MEPLTQITSILFARQPGPANEAPDNSRKISIGKREMIENKEKLKCDLGPQISAKRANDTSLACLDAHP